MYGQQSQSVAVLVLSIVLAMSHVEAKLIGWVFCGLFIVDGDRQDAFNSDEASWLVIHIGLEIPR